MKQRNKFLAIVIACFLCACCGNKGVLYLEPEKVPQPIRGVSLQQKGNAIHLEWSFPQSLTDEKTPIDLEKIGRLLVYCTDKQVPPDRFARKAPLYAKLPLKELQRLGGRSFTTSLSFRTRELKNRKYLFALAFEYAKKRSEISPVVAIDTLIPPEPVNDLALVQEKKTIILRWKPPIRDITDKPLAKPPAGYWVYRAVQTDKGPAAFRRLNATPLPHPYYEDSDLSQEGEFSYAVATLLSGQVESELSNRVHIKVSDVFPPDTPQQLVAFSGPDHVLLTWEPVADTDLAHYRVYRKEKEAGQFKLLADGIKENQYRDLQVKKGLTYFYSVAAVDSRGNESEPGPTVRHEFQ